MLVESLVKVYIPKVFKSASLQPPPLLSSRLPQNKTTPEFKVPHTFVAVPVPVPVLLLFPVPVEVTLPLPVLPVPIPVPVGLPLVLIVIPVIVPISPLILVLVSSPNSSNAEVGSAVVPSTEVIILASARVTETYHEDTSGGYSARIEDTLEGGC